MRSPIPRKLGQGLIEEAIGAEILLYDEHCHRAFCLNPVASAIWSKCDGVRSSEEIAQAVSGEVGFKVGNEAVCLAIRDFQRDKLLMSPEEVTLPTLSRPDIVRKLGYNAALLLPVVASITAPSAAQAYSGCVDCNSQAIPQPEETVIPEIGGASPSKINEPYGSRYMDELPPSAAPAKPAALP